MFSRAITVLVLTLALIWTLTRHVDVLVRSHMIAMADCIINRDV